MKGIEQIEGVGIMCTGPGIAMYRLLAMKHCLKAEIQGFRMVRHSVYAQVKREFGFRGNKENVLEQLENHIAWFAADNQ